MPLLGWDLLTKLGAQIAFENGRIQVHFPEANARQAQIYLLQMETEEFETIPEEIKNAVNPFAWGMEKQGRAKNVELVKIELKAGA